MTMWAKATFPMDLQASSEALDLGLERLDGYPGIGLASFDAARQVFVVPYDDGCHSLASLTQLLLAVNLPVLPEPLPAPVA